VRQPSFWASWHFMGIKMNQAFFNDLARGFDIEEKILYLIRQKYPCASLVHKYKGYDIWIPELHKSMEVKYDPMSNETGNIVIEIEMFNKRSALMTTNADFWAFYDDNVFQIMKPMDIVHCIFINRLQYREFVGNGDTASKKAFLVPKELLFKYGKTLQEY
jgi:hypothetical protein